MLPRTWLVIVILLLCNSIYAQADSLGFAAFGDSLATADSIGYWAENDSLAATEIKVTKAEVELWLDELEANNSVSVLDHAALQRDFGDIYNNGYFFIGRPNVAMPYLYGFEQLAGVFSASLYHGYYYSLYPSVTAGANIDYVETEYPFTPALSCIQAGLGDYEHRFAKISLWKNNLLSFKGVTYKGNLLVQNGYWTDIISAETSQKHYLSYRGEQLTVEAEYAFWAKDVAMSELLPVYWINNNYSISHQLKHYYLGLKSKFGAVSVIHLKESASASQFAADISGEATKIMLSTGMNLGIMQYNAFYEHVISESDFDFPAAFAAESYQNKIGLAVAGAVPIDYTFKADLLDWERGRIFADLSKGVKSIRIGAYANLLAGENAFVDSVVSIYNPAELFPHLDVDTRREAAAYLSYDWWGSTALLAAGSKAIKQDSPIALLQAENEQIFVKLALAIKHKYKSWELQANPAWTWAKANSGMVESPEFRFQSVQNLSYHLPWNNSLVAGFSVNGHSGYYAANALMPYLIEASTILDAWGGFDIDHYFQFRAGVKNVFSSAIYSAYPVPLSTYAELKWYYLN
ncbi:MAG: hypothetical protein PHO32_09890 [Candidatus Cloacimonetes bacterium]|nr:hypothetical protein [Candidatus Cloacimonadota bacterium]